MGRLLEAIDNMANWKGIGMMKAIILLILATGLFGQNWIPFQQIDNPSYNPIRTNVGVDSLNIKEGFARQYKVRLDLSFIPNFISPNWTLRAAETNVYIDMNNDGILEVDYTGNQIIFTQIFDYPELSYGNQSAHSIRLKIEAKYFNPSGETIQEDYDILYNVITLPSPCENYVTNQNDLLVSFTSSDGVLDKPIILIEGIDSQNHTWPSTFYNIVKELYEDYLEPAGYDLFLLKYGDTIYFELSPSAVFDIICCVTFTGITLLYFCDKINKTCPILYSCCFIL